jgi:hypothetical protein
MTTKIFSVATFILVAWLTVTLVTTSKQLTATEQLLSSKIDTSHQRLTDRINTLEQLYNVAQQTVPAPTPAQIPAPPQDTAELDALRAETDQLRAQLNNKTNLQDLKTAYRQVIETEFEKQVDATAAAEKLLSTKEAIWKASTLHESEKSNLQGLMAPIDILAAQWKRGDTQSTVKPVFDVLQQTLSSLDAY